VTRKNLFSILLAAAVALPATSSSHAQTQSNSTASGQNSVDQDVDLLRKDVRSQKKQIIAANLKLTDAEAEKFWPIYDQYTAELVKINDAKYAAIKEYAQNYDTLTDDQATALTKQIIAVDGQVSQLRERYVPIVGKILPGKKTALFFQLDRRLVMLIDIQLATQIPMVQQ
jgi:1-aminocyclopropane-1-carboxylate deaminase/D-cysteine desulfhydrase-like pyridoxal-dependent ACC family enzyme